jgi:hypothetical protein
LVLIRTRNPCVRLRRRVLGWNVRTPLAMQSLRTLARRRGRDQPASFRASGARN